jgi:hypothetical protein
MEYKFSASTIEEIFIFLKSNFDFDFEEKSAMLNNTDALVFINGTGKIPNEVTEQGEVISYLDGFHFDILTSKELNITEGIKAHFPNNPKHKFA